MGSIPVTLLVEDVLQEVVFKRLIADYCQNVCISEVLGKKGKLYIKDNFINICRASETSHLLILVDLDDCACPVQLLEDWNTKRLRQNCLFRIAEKEVEAWLLADKENMSEFLGIHANKINSRTENINKPKEFIIQLARKSRKKFVKDIIPQGNSKQGPLYNSHLSSFVRDNWNPENARLNNRSLDKAIRRLACLSTAS